MNLSRRAILGLAGIGALGLALSACQVRPLYGDQDLVNGGSQTANALSTILIDPPTDRTTQLVRNELVFGINADGQTPAYRLALRATIGEQTLGVSGTGAAFARTLLVTASYQLFEIGETVPILENTVITTASYDSVEQRFANQRAAIDAETRATREAARAIEAQLAAAFATGR